MADADRLSPAVVAHCDWSKDPGKRWMAVARREGRGWHLAPPEPVGPSAGLFDRLQTGRPGGLLVGFDFPIGLPAAYGRLTGFADYPQALARFGRGDWSDWFEVCETESQISARRPFYPYRPGGRRRAHLLAGLGLTAAELTRRCDRATAERAAACMLFWTLGGNQVGKGAIAGWRELVAPNLGALGLWPFAGSLPDLLRRHPVVVAETYPGEVYGHLGIWRRTRWSKRRQEGRRSVAHHLLARLDACRFDAPADLQSLIADGFGPDKSGEDPFDALVGLFGMLDVVDGLRPEGVPDDPAVSTWEGWILGQAAA